MRRALGAWVAALTIALTGCGASNDARHATAAARREVGPQWQDAFDGSPELFAVVRPPLFKKDSVYGPFFKALLRVADARSEMGGARALEALEGAEEIYIGMQRAPEHDDIDASIVLRGVPANLDPERMSDERGRPLFALVDARSRVREYERTDRRAGVGSVFVLPERTWVVAMGSARERARQAFTTPLGRSAPNTDPNALASVRIEAAALLRTERLARSRLFGPLVRKLSAVTLSLQPGKAGVLATLRYEEEDAAAWAEMHARQILEELLRASTDSQRPAWASSLGWLKDAKISREGTAVLARLPLPTRLLEELPKATASDIPL